MKESIHDIKSPIGGISGYLELLGLCLDNDRDKEKLYRYKNQIGKGLNEIEYIVSQLDQMAKENFSAQAGDFQIETDIGWVVEEVCNSMENRCRQKKIELVYENKVNSLYLTIDYILLKLIMTNLICSAVKFTSKPGKISLMVNKKENAAFIHLKCDNVARDPNEIENEFLKEKSNFKNSGVDSEVERRPVSFGANFVRWVHENAEMSIDTSKSVVVTIQFNLDE